MNHQRGEGKVGCILTLLVFGALAAAGYKAIPVYYSDSELVDACDFIASSAARKPLEVIEREVRAKARDLNIPEVLANKQAVSVSKGGTADAGTCTITLRYKRVVDFYGIHQWTKETNERISKPIFENIN